MFCFLSNFLLTREQQLRVKVKSTRHWLIVSKKIISSAKVLKYQEDKNWQKEQRTKGEEQGRKTFKESKEKRQKNKKYKDQKSKKLTDW